MGNHRDPAIIAQMQRTHPARKDAITELTATELGKPQKGINREAFDLKLMKLKHDVATGLGCLRNKHLLTLLFSSKQQVTPSARETATNYFDYANVIVQVKLPMYFYQAWVACRLVPANKLDPLDLPAGTTMDHRPVNVGNAERRHITRAYYDEELQAAYN